ncbi:MAG: hypothetical protein V4772_20955 [Pseudomonadota bacterium]
MDFFILAALSGIGFYILKAKDQRTRIMLLASYLGRYQLEKLMETLTQGYLRALGESDLNRREQIWLQEQFSRFVAEFSKLDENATRVSTIAVALPYAAQWLPSASFDLRKVFAIHAQGISDVVANQNPVRSARDKAFTLSAELILMQHTCHWFCKSKTVASARMQIRHQTTHAQLLAAVSPATRQAYVALTGLDN